jgi:hypothetical protein
MTLVLINSCAAILRDKHMKFSLMLLFLFVLFCPSYYSQWKEDGKHIEDTIARKAVNGFGANLILADRPKEFMQEWSRPEKPELWSTSVAKRGEPLAAFIMFAGCLPDNRGICNTEVDFQVFKPDGSLWAERKGLDLWKKVAPPAANTQLSTANIIIRIQPNDPAGEYKVKASVRDLNRKVSFDLEEKFKVE